MSYLVLARKYRPQRFSELVGQEHVARTLANAIAQNRVHHAFLFTGARGVGKTSAARILAKALACEKGPTAEPCGVCDLCQEIAGGRSVDVIEIDAASNTKVEETKSVLEGVRYLPARARRKVFIIDEVHMLSAHSFNALLKTLEEPPPHVVFVFATTEVHKIPVTILSRCQRFDFKLIPTARLAAHLEGILRAENIDAAPEAVRLVARQAAGSVRDGLSLLDQAIAYMGTERLTAEVTAEVLGIADRRMLVELAGAVLDRQAATALRLLAGAVDRGVDLAELGRSFLAFLRDLEVVARIKAGGSSELGDLVDASPEELEEIRALATRAVPGLVPVLFDRWARAVDEGSRASTPRLLYEMAAVDLCAAEPLLPLGDLLERLEDLERRLRSGGGSSGDPVPGKVPTSKAPAGPPPRTWSGPPAGSRSTQDRGQDRGEDRGHDRDQVRDQDRDQVRGSSAGNGFSASPPLAVAPRATEAPSPTKPAPVPAAAPRTTEPPAPTQAVAAQAAPPAAPAPSTEASGGVNDPAEVWRRVLASLEGKRPRLGALLAHAEVVSLAAATATLAFGEKRDADSAEKERTQIEAELSAVLGRAIRVTFSVGVRPGAAVRSAVARETDADLADRKQRETEARQHPVIRRAQDVFGAALKEIKT